MLDWIVISHIPTLSVITLLIALFYSIYKNDRNRKIDLKRRIIEKLDKNFPILIACRDRFEAMKNSTKHPGIRTDSEGFTNMCNKMIIEHDKIRNEFSRGYKSTEKIYQDTCKWYNLVEPLSQILNDIYRMDREAGMPAFRK